MEMMFDQDTIYLDYNATTPVDQLVAESMRPYIDKYFGNPSSPHAFGLEAKNAVEYAREQVAHSLGCHAGEIVFTSGGTESNNMAIKGVAFASQGKGKHIITSAIEHPAVIEVCRYLDKHGFVTTYLPVDQYGMVNPDDLRKAIRKDTILVSIMHANNEVGTIQPIAELAGICREKDILFHTDAAQSVGKIPARVEELGVDLMSVAGHKFYGPKGIGALYIRGGVILEKFMHGADHERNRRAGTENVIDIVGLGRASEIAAGNLGRNMAGMLKMRDMLHNGMLDAGLDIRLNGHQRLRLPNTLSIGFRNIPVSDLLYAMVDLAVSAGAACHGADITSSYVLQAMKVPEQYANGTIRFSVGRYTTEEEIEAALDIIRPAVLRMQEGQP